MRLLLALHLALLAFAPAAAAQQPVDACGEWGSFDWRAHFGFGPDALVYSPEVRPEPVSDELVSRIPHSGLRPEAGTFSIAVVLVDTAGVAENIDIACAPSEAVAAGIVSLIQRSEFVPAQDRGKPFRHYVFLPIMSAKPCE